MATDTRPDPIRDVAGSPDRFGWEWNVYSQILPEYEEQFRRWTTLLGVEEWQNCSFLDVGCGMGRNTYWPLRYGAREGVAIDVDERSLAAARRNLAQYDNATVLQCSVFDLPFEDRFDIVFSLGVVHHLDDPKTALKRMARAARPGSGRVLIWVYGLENNRWLVGVLDPLRKALFSRLPIRLTHHLSLYPTVLLWLLLRLRFRPTEYFRLISTFGFRHLRSIVFDQMLPRVASYWSRSEVLGLMEEAGLHDIRLAWVNQMSWSAIGTRAPLYAESEKDAIAV